LIIIYLFLKIFEDLSGIFIKIVVNWQQILNVVTTFDLDELPKQAADSA
jgi:hypothetical protein